MITVKSKFLLCSLLFLPCFSYANEVILNGVKVDLKEVSNNDTGTTFSIKETHFKDALPMIYGEVLKRSFMVDPVILERKEKITFSMIDEKDPHGFFKRYFENFNIKIFTKNGVDYLKYIEPKKDTKLKVKFSSYVYNPKYRGVGYLSDNLSTFIQSSLNENDDIKTKSSINVKGDKLIIYSDVETIKRVKDILPKIDVKPEQVVVNARILEVKKIHSKESGLSILLNSLSSKLNVNLNLGTIADNTVNLKLKNISSIFGMIETDNNFNVISSPILRVLDGERGTFTVGSDVPTVSGETVNNYGTVTKNINYVSAGVIFDVMPIITQEGIRLKVKSELSDFTKTENGVNDTPTLLKRLVDSTVYMEDGSLVILGGLSEEKNTKVDDSFFFIPPEIFGRSKKFEKSDVLLLLYAKKIDGYNAVDLDQQIKIQHPKTFKQLNEMK